MIGSIIGDIVGSIYEFHNIKTKEFPFFSERMDYTDDSILTIATANWILDGGNTSDCWRYYFLYAEKFRYPMGGYGLGFDKWVNKAKYGNYEPYNSCGNGSAMRVGPVGWAYTTKEEVLRSAKASAECTHNHPEGIKGAQAVALCIFMARNGAAKEDIRNAIESEFGYDLGFTCDEIRSSYGWHSIYGDGGICQCSVPQAIVAFLEGKDFEDCIRNAISIGGDSDTIGCITGSIAEAFFGVPEDIYNKAIAYLPSNLKDVVTDFENTYGNKII